MKVTIEQIAAALAREVRNFGHCRQKLHRDGPCGCGHCVALAMYDKHGTAAPAITAAAELRAKADQPGERHD